MTVSNELLSATLHRIRKPAVDQLFRSTPILDLLRKKKGYIVGYHGPKVVIPYAVTTHTVPTAFPTGSERANRSIQDVLRPAEFYPADLGSVLFLSRKEESENTGDGMVVKLAETRFKAALGGQKRSVNTQLLAGSDVTANTAGLHTLYGHSSVTSNGFIEFRSAQVNTVGGIAKDLGPSGLKNAWADAGDLFGTNGLDGMASIVVDTRTNSELGEPDIIIAKPAAFRNYKKAMFANERFTQSDKLDAGRLDLAYGDATIAPDPAMPDSSTADFEASMYFLNSQGVQVYCWEGNDFDLGNWFQVANGEQEGRMAWLYTKIQLVAIQLSSCGGLGDANTYA